MQKKPLSELVDRHSYGTLCNNVLKTRKVDGDGHATYDKLEHKHGDTVYMVEAIPVSIDEIKNYAKPNCNKCTEKGYYVMRVEKSKIKDPENYYMVASQPINAMSEEQRKIWIEKEKKNKYWRILYPCPCALKRAADKIDDFVHNPAGNITFRLEYQES